MSTRHRTRCFWARQEFFLMMALSIVLSLPFAKAGFAIESESVQHYKMLSTVEYAGKSQFRNQVETLFTVRKQFLSDDKVQYSISTDDFDLVGRHWDSSQESSYKELSFVVDRKSRRLSETSKDLLLLEMVNNQCIRSLKKVTRNNIGKTWKQSFNLSFLGGSLPDELKLTLTAMQLKTEVFGEMVAVRALSEPFVFSATKEDGSVGSVKSRINTVYLFDSEIEDIYVSVSVFEATTDMNGYKEKLRHEIATYKTGTAGKSVDLSGLGKKFAKLVRKVGLSGKSIKVAKKSALPRWGQSEGLRAAQVANICAATACEGSINPVVTVCMPAARAIALQSGGRLVTAKMVATTSSLLVQSIPGAGGMKIAAAPAFMGMGLGTAGAVAGGTVGTIAVAGGFDSDSHHRSPLN